MKLQNKLALFSIFLFLSLPLAAYTEVLLNHQSNGVALKVKQNPHAIDISLTGPKYKESKIFKLKSPARIVVDLNGSFPKIKESFVLNGDPSFRELRVATHPDKLRLVLELTDPEAPNYTYADGQTSFFLRANRNTRPENQRTVRQNTQPQAQQTVRENIQPEPRFPEMKNSIPEGPSALNSLGVANVKTDQPNTARARMKPEPQFMNEAQAPLNQESVIERPIPQANSEQPIVSKENLAERPALQGAGLMDISFMEPIEPGDLGGVQLTLTEPDTFTLLRTDAKEYKLILTKTVETGVRPNLPYYPPQGIEGITVVTTAIENGKVVLNIGTNSGYRMRATGSDRNIIIKAVVSE